MNEFIEERLQAILKDLPYPATPDLAAMVMPRIRGRLPRRRIPRRFALVWIAILILVSSMLLVPPARAAILEFIQIGIVRIFRSTSDQEAPTVEVTRTARLETGSALTRSPDERDTIISLLDELSGETTLGQAQLEVDFPIQLPAYPDDLGYPDRVFVQDAVGKMVILVWLDDQAPTQIRMSLHTIPEGSWIIEKFKPTILQETSVNRRPAVWTVGPYPLILRNKEVELTRMINGHVLIWAEGDVTYRLEMNVSLEEAIRTAESLIPWDAIRTSPTSHP